MHITECLYQTNTRGIAPNQHRAARHQINLDPLPPDHAIILAGSFFDQTFEILEPHCRVCKGVRKVQDRVVGGLTVDPVQGQLSRLRQSFEHHRAGLVDRCQLRRVTEQQEGWEDFFQILELPVVQHRSFVDEPDIKRLFPALPTCDEVGAP